MTKEEWAKVNESVQSVFMSGAKLEIDGYEVYLKLMQVSQFKNAIAIWINGAFKGEWLTEDCEERRRFLPCKTKTLVTPKDIKNYGIRGKKQIQAFKERYSYNLYSNMWTNFNAMRKHFEANNDNIKLLEVIIP